MGDAEGLLSTFNALLRIARIESGGRRQEFAPFSVTVAVDDVVELYGPLLEEAGLRLEMSSEPDLELTGDRDLVFQAVAELHQATLTLEDNSPGLRVVLRFPTAGPRPNAGP